MSVCGHVPDRFEDKTHLLDVFE